MLFYMLFYILFTKARKNEARIIPTMHTIWASL
jgi:hypothetical protein